MTEYALDLSLSREDYVNCGSVTIGSALYSVEVDFIYQSTGTLGFIWGIGGRDGLAYQNGWLKYYGSQGYRLSLPYSLQIGERYKIKLEHYASGSSRILSNDVLVGETNHGFAHDIPSSQLTIGRLMQGLGYWLGITAISARLDVPSDPTQNREYVFNTPSDVIPDLSGNGADATRVGGTWVVIGSSGESIQFDASPELDVSASKNTSETLSASLIPSVDVIPSKTAQDAIQVNVDPSLELSTQKTTTDSLSANVSPELALSPKASLRDQISLTTYPDIQINPGEPIEFNLSPSISIASEKSVQEEINLNIDPDFEVVGSKSVNDTAPVSADLQIGLSSSKSTADQIDFPMGMDFSLTTQRTGRGLSPALIVIDATYYNEITKTAEWQGVITR